MADMNEYLQRANRIMEKINELASISEDPKCITRTFGTNAFMEGSNKVLSWMKAAGLQASIDNIGNVRGRRSCNNANAGTFVIASHIDTVNNAGKFDGPLGVIMGLDIVEHLNRSTDLPFNIELIAFSDEEGCRFHTTYLGSKVVTGAFDTALLDKKDAAGISLKQALQTMGCNEVLLSGDCIPPGKWLGYFEIHIEQGPVLYNKNVPVAIVESIAAQRRAQVTFSGVAGHAGTVPMAMRNDALAAAAEFVLEVEKLALHNNNLVATVGTLHIKNAASNVIPGEVMCTLDIRSADEAILSASFSVLHQAAENIGSKRSIGIEWKPVQQTKPVFCDTVLNAALSKAISDAGFEVIPLVSGAGHDAVPVSAISPVCMLFVRCFEGISHNPLEDVEIKDIAAAVQVSDNFVHNLIEKYNHQ
jgi:allantoate deiminase